MDRYTCYFVISHLHSANYQIANNTKIYFGNLMFMIHYMYNIEQLLHLISIDILNNYYS